jgi:hypothetical protein
MTTNANEITFMGTIAEETCSNNSHIEKCITFQKIINNAVNTNTDVLDIEKLLEPLENDFSHISVDKLKNNLGIILVNYH